MLKLLTFNNQLSQFMRLYGTSHRRPATSEGSGEPVHLRSLVRAFAVRTHEVSKWMKGPTKNQTSNSTGWLRMHVWRMSLRRTKRAIISWRGSFYQNPWSISYKCWLRPHILMKNSVYGLDVLLLSSAEVYLEQFNYTINSSWKSKYLSNHQWVILTLA